MKTRYSKYKPSGIEWIGDIPNHWYRIPFKYEIDVFTDFTSNGSFKSLKDNVEYLESGYSRLVRLTDLRVGLKNEGIYVSKESHEFLNKSELFGGEILISCVGHYTGFVVKMLYNQGVSTLGPNMYLVKNKPNTTDVDFLIYLLNSEPFQIGMNFGINKTTQEKINKENVKDLQIIRPPLHEQEQIVKYLDGKTQEIDNLISITESKIELLKENRTSLINRVITKGLDPNVEMKDSGIEWIGDIPKHWTKTKVKHETRQVIDGTHFTPEYIDIGIPFLRVTDIQEKEIDLNNVKYISQKEHLELTKRTKPEKGDLLLSKNGTIGITKVIDWDWEFSIFVSLCLIKFKKDYSQYFFSYAFKSDLINQQLVESSKTSTVTNLHLEKIRELILIKPALPEQEEIVKYLDQKTQEIDNLISIEQQRIETLKEYRQSLISEVVTGKMRVCEEVKS